MSDQLALVGPATPPGMKLGKQQRFALELVHVVFNEREVEELVAALKKPKNETAAALRAALKKVGNR